MKKQTIVRDLLGGKNIHQAKLDFEEYVHILYDAESEDVRDTIYRALENFNREKGKQTSDQRKQLMRWAERSAYEMVGELRYELYDSRITSKTKLADDIFNLCEHTSKHKNRENFNLLTK